MTDLKLMALDVEDLKILSAHIQDAVFKINDLDWQPSQSQVTMVINRFVWEEARPRGLFSRLKRSYERRRAALTFSRVRALHTKGINRADNTAVAALLALDFTATASPAGHLDLICADGAVVRLEVECIEAQLADLGAAWSTQSRPDHDKDAEF